MGYERNDRSYGRDQGRFGSERDQGRERYGYDRDRNSYGRDQQRGYGRQPQGYDYDDRGFFDRAGDEVRSWFGDEDAERRRRLDERHDERDDRGRYGARDASSSYGRNYGADRDRYESRAPGVNYGGGTNAGAGDSGADFSAGAAGLYGARRGNDRDDTHRDPNYHSWRSRQIEQFDRDYDEYRREHQSKFDTEFHGWRQNRQTQRDSLGRVREHQEVVGSDGQHVGTVDHVKSDRILLTKNDQDAHGHHHSIPSSWIQSVDEKVNISKTAEQAKAHWQDEEKRGAIGGGGRDGDRGQDRQPGNLNRSFSGTY